MESKMGIDRNEIIRVLHMLSKTAMNQTQSCDNAKDALFWAGIKTGLSTAKYLIAHGKPPENFEEAAMADEIDGTTLH